MDVLRELSKHEINHILKKMEEHLPRTLKDIYYIKTALRASKMASRSPNTFSDKVLPRFYTHRQGKIENCTVVGITGANDHTVWYFTFDNSLTEIRECLNKTQLIKWGNLKLLFVTIHLEQIQPIIEYADEHKLAVEVNEYAGYYSLSREEAISLKFDLPKGTIIRKLNISDAQFVNSMWTFRDEKSELWIKSLIEINGGYALIDEMTKEILSYAILNDHTGIGALTTIEKAKRKGYAEVVTKFVAREIAARGFTPLAFIQDQNFKSLNLFHKLGFTRIGGSNWIIIAQSPSGENA